MRVEQALRDAGDPRLDRAERRVLDEIDRRAEPEAPPEEAEVPESVGHTGPLVGHTGPSAPEAPATPIAGDDDDEPYESRVDANGDAVMRLKPAAVAELYSPPRVTATLPRLGLDV